MSDDTPNPVPAYGGVSSRLDRIEVRLDRMEQRLGLVETS